MWDGATSSRAIFAKTVQQRDGTVCIADGLVGGRSGGRVVEVKRKRRDSGKGREKTQAKRRAARGYEMGRGAEEPAEELKVPRYLQAVG